MDRQAKVAKKPSAAKAELKRRMTVLAEQSLFKEDEPEQV
jgi:hypothetical protein